MTSFILLGVSCAIGGYLIGIFIGTKRACKAEDRADRYLFAILDLDRWCGHPFPAARVIAKHLKAVGEGEALNAGTPSGEEPCTVMGLREQLTRLQRPELGALPRPVGVIKKSPTHHGWHMEALLPWETIGINTVLYDSPPAGTANNLDAAARDVLAERRRQQEVEGWTTDHDDEHLSGEISALAAFYAMPPAARDWNASSTGYGETLGEAMLPPEWRAKPGERREELKKAGALILAEIERIDRATLAERNSP
ncbi:hypothetical protein [Herbaspirillum huttiense]|uniref:hypothetical protein n=1 Tax=Herbaspirillum huttiense TaxID=863372 RepID=UPI0031CFDCF7